MLYFERRFEYLPRYNKSPEWGLCQRLINLHVTSSPTTHCHNTTTHLSHLPTLFFLFLFFLSLPMIKKILLVRLIHKIIVNYGVGYNYDFEFFI